MPDTWITDIRHFLGPDDEPTPLPVPAQRLATFLGSLIQAASVRPAGLVEHTPVRCRRRPRRQPCPGFILVERREVPAEIRWSCPLCGDNGLITNWTKTPWDLSEIPECERDESDPFVEVFLEDRQYDLLRSISILDGEAERTLFRADVTGEGILLGAFLDEIEHLQGFVAAEANHEERSWRQRRLERVYERIEDGILSIDPRNAAPDAAFDPLMELLGAQSRQRPARGRSRRTMGEHTGRGKRARAKGDCVYDLRIELADVRPAVWRRFRVSREITLQGLHDVIQKVMGWTDSHLHCFEIGDARYGVPDPEDYLPVQDERKVRLRDVVPEPPTPFVYVYDFGDDWRHEIVVEGVSAPDRSTRTPVCLAGERACPPEDSGGPMGYEELMSVLRDPTHPDFEHYRSWAGESFNPEGFDLKAVNRKL